VRKANFQIRHLAPKRLFRRLNNVLARVGPHRVVTRRYFGTKDIAMTSLLLEVEAYRRDIVPQPLPITSLKRVLVLAPHQDDETIGAGGALLIARNAGVEISIAYCTDGQQHGIESEVRRKEAEAVCEQLGATMYELNISNVEPRPTVEDLRRLNDLVAKVNPDVILCPWILDGASKHRMVNHLLWLANRLNPLPDVEVWGYQVQNNLLPNGYIDITDVAAEKAALLECFRSQNRDRHWDHVAMGLAAWNSRLLSKSREPVFAEVFFTLPVKDLLTLVENFYFKDFEVTYDGEPRLLANISALHLAVTQV
jgi:N-acetylglucosamine malate deacetylase 1